MRLLCTGGKCLLGPVEGRSSRRAKCIYLSPATEGRRNLAGIAQEVMDLEGRQNRLIVHDTILESDMAARQWFVAVHYRLLCNALCQRLISCPNA